MNPDINVIGLFEGTSMGTLIAVGGMTALETLGIDISALVAGLGLSGFALSFAFRDAISNFLAGKKGIVREIKLRHTILENENEA